MIYIYIDKDGDWHNCRHNVTFVSPELNVSSYAAVLASTVDLWCYKYSLKSGDVVIDIGAGIGDDVVAFSRLVSEEGHVIAVEAHPVTFRCLLKTIKANKLKNVTAINVAVMDQEMDVHISDGEDYLANSITDNYGGILVRGCALDKILDEISVAMPNLIKMNIEGSETAALRGMPKTLQHSSNVVISCHDFVAENHGGDYCLRTSADVIKLLHEAGYKVSRRSDSFREEIRDYVYAKN